MFPFVEKKLSENVVVREFSPDADAKDLVWHRDKEDRVVEIIQADGWWFQMDDEVPRTIAGTLFIKANTWHRIIKGPDCSRPLIVKIRKLY